MTASPPSRRPGARATALPAALCLASLVLALLAAVAAPGFAAGDKISEAIESKVEPQQQWQIKADSLLAEHDQEVLEAHGNVVLSRGDNYLKADDATYYRTTGWVHLSGNVEVRWSLDRLRADEAEFDLKNKVGWLRNGEVFVSDPHLYFQGERIEKHEGDRYSFQKARVTACDDASGAWSIDMEEGEITLEGYAWLWHPKFNVGDQPIFYSPVAILPVKEKRQSGLLLPDVGHSSRLGMNVNQPIYWAISDEADLTLYENWMSERGLMQGVEFRHTPDSGTKGLWRIDAMDDQVTEPSEADEDSQFQGDALVRSNAARYWWRSKLDTHLVDPRWKAKLDIDWVSDQNYLREFKAGKSGFTKSREEFLREFSRDIADADALERESALLLSRSWDKGGVAGKAAWTQNLEHQAGNREKDRNPTAQRLPELHAYLWKDHVFSGPLEFEADMGATNFWRRFGTRGTRVDAHPKVSLPMQAGSVSVVPTLGLMETAYLVDEYENRTEAQHDDNVTARHLPTLNIAAFTERYKVFDLAEGKEELNVDAAHEGDSRWAALKHAVQPRVEYDWVPYLSQKNKPFFDELDRMAARNEITYSLTNILDRKRETVTVARTLDEGGRETGQETGLSVDYLEFLRLRLEQSWSAREASRQDERRDYPRRPFSDVMAEVTVAPEDWVRLTSRSYWSPDDAEITAHEHVIQGIWKDVARAEFGVDYQRPTDDYRRAARERIRQLRYGLDIFVSRRWSLGFTYRTDLVTDTDLEKTISATYQHQCWGLTLAITQTPFEDRVEARVELLGLSF